MTTRRAPRDPSPGEKRTQFYVHVYYSVRDLSKKHNHRGREYLFLQIFGYSFVGFNVTGAIQDYRCPLLE